VWSGTDRQVLDNVRSLAGYRRPSTIDTKLISAVLDAAAHERSIRAVEHALSPHHPPLLVRPVVRPLWTGQLRTDLTHPLSADALLRRGEEVVAG
jgi:hypothetical protein